MRRAIVLARKACGRTSPNPMVGAVVVKGGEVVGEGYHSRAGQPHAEIEALSRAGHYAVLLISTSHWSRAAILVGRLPARKRSLRLASKESLWV